MSLKIIIFVLVMIAFIVSGCSQTSIVPAATNNASKNNDSNSRKVPDEITNPTTDPDCCTYLHDEAKGIEKAWSEFTKDGRYRLATRADMKFPDSVKQEYGKNCDNIYRPFAYPWGDRGFDTLKRHLVAIVIDTTRNDASKFSLMIFSAKGKSEDYKQYWIYKNKDLSRAAIDAPSGDLRIFNYNDDGTAYVCDVNWSEKENRYTCISDIRTFGPPKICLY